MSTDHSEFIAAHARQAAEERAERERASEQRREKQKRWDEAWLSLYQALAKLPRCPPDQQDAPASRVEEAVRAIGPMLSEKGWDKWLPGMAENFRRNPDDLLADHPSCLAVTDLLILALGAETSPGAIGRKAKEYAGLSFREGLHFGASALDGVPYYLNLRAADAARPKLAAAKVEEKPADEQAPAPESRPEGVGPRNAKFMEWYEAEGTDTCHKPAAIWRRWDDMTQRDRAAICPACPNRISKAAVRQAIKRALERRKVKLARSRSARRKSGEMSLDVPRCT